jgi:hypothetical protein
MNTQGLDYDYTKVSFNPVIHDEVINHIQNYEISDIDNEELVLSFLFGFGLSLTSNS